MKCKNCGSTMDKATAYGDGSWVCWNCKTEYHKWQGRGQCWWDWGVDPDEIKEATMSKADKIADEIQKMKDRYDELYEAKVFVENLQQDILDIEEKIKYRLGSEREIDAVLHDVDYEMAEIKEERAEKMIELTKARKEKL